MTDNKKAVEAGMRFINSESLPEEMSAMLSPFDNDHFCGLVVKWAKRGTGFGEITVSCDKKTKEWKVDTEEMGPEFCGEAFIALRKTQKLKPTDADATGFTFTLGRQVLNKKDHVILVPDQLADWVDELTKTNQK